ncbi:pirin family protein [Limisalsivibrio acetivorans]|uniref:pirin family protein n=1 Tax=Limisalsivibrio acetivorans TaxID=1304888 RepID=UPI0003B68266|nr:pirin-like bicupin family protein [Limisalsivibrio acetivorans]
MIEIIPASQRCYSDFGWLKTYWLFSFSNYYDPDNISFGDLRVFNDDIVEPGTGFPTHPHENMEIVTVVLSGSVTHEDSTGGRMTIRAGEVQRMSAGSGITHSEYNLGKEPVHFLQIWVRPRRKGGEPSYEQKSFDETLWENRLAPIATGNPKLKNCLSINSDATIYRSKLSSGRGFELDAGDNRRIFVYLTKGKLAVNGRRLSAGDQARADLECFLSIKADDDADFILIDIPSSKGFGYDSKTLKGTRLG